MHGNAAALDAVLAELDRCATVDEIVCLGDVAQGGAQAGDVVDRMSAIRDSGMPDAERSALEWRTE